MRKELKDMYEYHAGSKYYRSQLKYYIALMMYFTHVEEDYGYHIAENFKEVAKSFKKTNILYDLTSRNKITTILQSMYNHGLLHKETKFVKGKKRVTKIKRVYYSITKPAFAHFFIKNYNISRAISIQDIEGDKNASDDNKFDTLLLNYDFKLFNKTQRETFNKLLDYIQYYSSDMSTKDVITNITKYQRYDLYTYFIYVRDILKTIQQYSEIQRLLDKYDELSVRSVGSVQKQNSIEVTHNNQIEIYDLKNKKILLLNKKTSYIIEEYTERLNNPEVKDVTTEFYIIYTVESLKKWKSSLGNHYIIKYNSSKEKIKDIIYTFHNNNITDLITFIDGSIVNTLYLERQ